MRYLAVATYLLICSCVHIPGLKVSDTELSRSPEMQIEIDAILAEDAENKKWERLYLKELVIAQENNDQEAFKFYVVEYIKLPRLVLPEWMTKEPNYVPPVSETEIIRGQIRIILKPE